LAQSGAYATRNAQQLFGMEGDLVSAMADRAYNRQLSKANRMWSEYATMKDDSNKAIQAGLGMAMAPLTYGKPKIGDGTGVPVPGSSASPSLSDLFAGNSNAMLDKGITNDSSSRIAQMPFDQAGQNPWWM